MRSRSMFIGAVVAVVATACSATTDSPPAADAGLAWCAQANSSTMFDAIWDAADELGVETIGEFLLDKADITTDLDPRELSPEDLSEEEFVSLAEVGAAFDNSDVLWIEYLNSPDGSDACLAAYANVNG